MNTHQIINHWSRLISSYQVVSVHIYICSLIQWNVVFCVSAEVVAGSKEGEWLFLHYSICSFHLSVCICTLFTALDTEHYGPLSSPLVAEFKAKLKPYLIFVSSLTTFSLDCVFFIFFYFFNSDLIRTLKWTFEISYAVLLCSEVIWLWLVICHCHWCTYGY